MTEDTLNDTERETLAESLPDSLGPAGLRNIATERPTGFGEIVVDAVAPAVESIVAARTAAVARDRDALAAKIARVEALVDRWATTGPRGKYHPGATREIRAALAGTEDTARDTQRDNEGSDPADYGYDDLSRGANGVRIIPSYGPEHTTCRTCGRLAIDHTPGRFSIYGFCPVPADHGTDRADEEGGRE